MEPFSLDSSLDRYAELIVRVGLNLQPGQRLLLNGRNAALGVSLAAAPLAGAVARRAYEAQAQLVDTLWADETVSLVRHRHAPRDSFEQFASWRAQALLETMEGGDASLTVLAEDPFLLRDEDDETVGVERQTMLEQTRPAMNLLRRNVTNWCVVGAATPGWAARVFPGAAQEEQLTLLWQALFQVCRVDVPDPVQAWCTHIDDLVARSDYLNARRYRRLHFRSEGTDLLLGLPEQHRWASARFVSSNDITFVANLPTEEVFTLPHRLEAEGHITASRPMNYGGTIIEDMTLRFEEGRVVRASAQSGEKTLQQLLDTDEGARRLGEVALVPHSSPISRMGILFHNTLVDENAASHLALGSAYRFSLEDGPGMTAEALLAAGGNDSLLHADFMIGTADMDVDGLLGNGDREAIMRRGEWAF